jgi:hypothetical protein
MNADQLAKQYHDHRERLAQEQKQAQQAAIEKAKIKFRENVKTWLGEYLDEFESGDITIDTYNQGTPRVKFEMPLSFRGLRGAVAQGFDIPSADPCDSIDLYFPRCAARLYQTNPVRSIYEADIARLFHDLISILPKFQAERQEQEDRRRAEALDYRGFDRSGIDYWTPKRIEQFPDLTPKILDAAQARLDEIKSQEAERKSQDEQQQAIYEESHRLASIAADAWSQPFTVYLIEYGAHVEDGEESSEPITREFYSLNENPGPDGYYQALKSGLPIRRIKPNHVLSTEKVIISNEQDCPWECKRYVTIRSKRVEGAEAHVSIPPAEVYSERKIK